VSQAFPFGYKAIRGRKRPVPDKISAYQFGSDKRIYVQYFIFWEALD
jgi:hypothetical protein